MYDLDVLIRQGENYLHKLSYSQSSVNHHTRTWERVRSWCEENEVEGYDIEVQNRYLADAGLDDPANLTSHWRTERTYVEMLISLKETGRAPKRVVALKYVVPAGFADAYGAYRDDLDRKGLKLSTQQGYLSTARCFFASSGTDSPGSLTVASVARFSEAISGSAAQTRAAKLYVVRNILRFLAEHGDCPEDVAKCIPLIRSHKHSTIPSCYARREISSVLMDQSYESHLRSKRDRAIALLAGVLGMRVSDIKALRLEDIDWREKNLTFVQMKTQISQALPMPEEVWLALADYLKNERPDVDSDRVFMTATAPYHAIDSAHVFHRGITRAFSEAGVDIAGKHHGMHSLRHSMASGMLEDGVPYPTISAALGHCSTNVTKCYLSIDVESLRLIALEVPKCNKQ